MRSLGSAFGLARDDPERAKRVEGSSAPGGWGPRLRVTREAYARRVRQSNDNGVRHFWALIDRATITVSDTFGP